MSAPKICGDNPEGLSKPVPTKFEQSDQKILKEARQATGFSNSELIRRAVRLLGRQHDVNRGYNFLLELTPTPT